MADEADYLARGIRLFETGDLTGAEACLLQVDGDPTQRGKALAALGHVYLKTERLEKAESSLIQSLAIRRSPDTYLLLGECLYRQSKFPQAETAFQESMRRAPDSPEPCIMLGHVYAAQGRLPDAIRAYEQALLRHGNSSSARYYLAESLVRQGDLPRAATQLHYLLQHEPNYIPAILLMGDMAFHQKDFRQAIVEYCRALELEPVDGPVYERLGQAFNHISDFAQALQAFESSIHEHPTYWPCYIEAARICEAGRWLRKARRYYQAIVFVSDYREEASQAIARIDAHFSQFDLSEPNSDAPPPSSVAFQPPETMTRPRAAVTSELDPSVVLPPLTKPASQVPPQPAGAPAPSGGLSGWVQSKTGKLAESVKETIPTDAVKDAGRKILEASSDILPQGLKGLTGFLKKPPR